MPENSESVADEFERVIPGWLKSAIWNHALCACPDCGPRGVPHSWGLVIYGGMKEENERLRAALKAIIGTDPLKPSAMIRLATDALAMTRSGRTDG